LLAVVLINNQKQATNNPKQTPINMLRSLLAMLLLANYLLVVGAGLAVHRPEAPRYSAAHPYEHSRHCQQQNYLRLDCFEQCNGPQQAAKAKLPSGAGLHFLAQLKGLDVHCSSAELLVCRQPEVGSITTPALVGEASALVAGFGQHNYPPPRG
jgi:hypothetical protein